MWLLLFGSGVQSAVNLDGAALPVVHLPRHRRHVGAVHLDVLRHLHHLGPQDRRAQGGARRAGFAARHLLRQGARRVHRRAAAGDGVDPGRLLLRLLHAARAAAVLRRGAPHRHRLRRPRAGDRRVLRQPRGVPARRHLRGLSALLPLRGALPARPRAGLAARRCRASIR